MSTHAKFDPVFRGAFLFVFLFSLLALEANASPLPRPGLTTHLEVRNPSPMEGAGADVRKSSFKFFLLFYWMCSVLGHDHLILLPWFYTLLILPVDEFVLIRCVHLPRQVWQFGYRIPVAGGIAMGPAKDSGLFGKIKDKIKQWFTREEN